MPNPHWRVWVDWDADGVWGEAGEDISADALELRHRWGRAPGQPHAAPARLELKLRNADHKYSPPNGASPLAGNLKPGRRVWAQLAYPYDAFAGGDGAPLEGRIPTVDGSFAWAKLNGGANGFELYGNQVRAVTGGASDAVYTLEFGEADAHIGLLYRRGSNAQGGLALRAADSANYLRVRFGSLSAVLENVVDGAATVIRTGDALDSGVNYFIEVELHGESVRLFATDLDAGTLSRAVILDGGGAAGHLAATRHGLWHGGGSTADRWGEFGGWRSLFYGRVESIEPLPGRGDPSCRLVARDALAQLEEVRLFTLLAGSNLRSDAALDHILTWAGFPNAERYLDAGRDLIKDTPRALWGLSAREALRAVQDEEDGLVYVDGRGSMRLEAAAHRASGPHTTARATLRATRAASPYFSRLAWADGAAEIENAIAFRYRRLESQGPQTVWTLGDVPAVPPGESRDFLAESGYAAVDGFITPVAVTDYAGNAAEDGSGSDLTANLSVTLPLASTYQGRGTALRVTNDNLTSAVYLTLLRLRADYAYTETEAVSHQAQDAGSQGEHGLRAKLLDCRFIDHYAAAQDAAASRLARQQDARPWLALTLPNGAPANLIQLAHRVVSDRVAVDYAAMGIGQDFFIEGQELEAQAATGAVTARWLLRAA